MTREEQLPVIRLISNALQFKTMTLCIIRTFTSEIFAELCFNDLPELTYGAATWDTGPQV